jgi:hypothetical protein
MIPVTARPARNGFWLQALLLVLAGYWIYAPALHGGWLWDDGDEIFRNPLLRDPAGWWKIWITPGGVDYFPLKTTLQWCLWQAGGARPALYHLTSLALHVVSGLLFWRLLARLGVRLAWWGGLLFVVHPLAVESVAWISELKNTLSLPLLLLAMLAYLDFEDFRTARAYVLSLGFFLLALLGKTSVVMFPAVILLYGWSKRGRIGRRDIGDSLPFFVLSAGFGLVTLWFQHVRATAEWALPAVSPGSRLISAGLAIAFYFEKGVFPSGLLPIYPEWHLHPLSFWQCLPWPILAIALGGCWIRRSTWGRPALLGLGFFLLNLVPVLGFVPMAYHHIAWVADHFAYLSLLGLLGLGVAGAGRVVDRWERASAAWLRPCAMGVAAGVVVALAWESRAYASWFRSEETLWTRTLRRDPSLWMAHKNLGYAWSEQGRIPEAIDEYAVALSLNPDFPEAHNNLGSLLAERGQLPEALAQFQEAVRLAPHYWAARANLERAERALGRR